MCRALALRLWACMLLPATLALDTWRTDAAQNAPHKASQSTHTCAVTANEHVRGAWVVSEHPLACPIGSPTSRPCGAALEYVPERCGIARFSADFMDVLGDRELVLIGDSLMGQLFSALRCALNHSHLPTASPRIRYHNLRTSVDFGPTPHGWPFEPAGSHLDQFTREFHAAFSGVHQRTIVLYNEGAWYTAVRFAKYNLTADEVDALHAHSLQRVADYVHVRFRGTFIYRAMFPGHIGCHSARPSVAEYQRTHFNWDRFHKRNTAARRIAERAGWLVLDAYDVLDRVPSLHQSAVDCVHWCTGPGNPLLVVVDLLYTLIKQLPPQQREGR